MRIVVITRTRLFAVLTTSTKHYIHPRDKERRMRDTTETPKFNHQSFSHKKEKHSHDL